MPYETLRNVLCDQAMCFASSGAGNSVFVAISPYTCMVTAMASPPAMVARQHDFHRLGCMALSQLSMMGVSGSYELCEAQCIRSQPNVVAMSQRLTDHLHCIWQIHWTTVVAAIAVSLFVTVSAWCLAGASAAVASEVASEMG